MVSMVAAPPLFPGGPVSVVGVNPVLAARHYLGPTERGWAWSDEFGVMVLAPPTSRRLPLHWLELTRWCLRGEPNDGSRQFAAVKRYLRSELPHITTLVSYSDPSVGHTGALYRACNWIWAPTWHRLRPPPSGNGAWADGEKQGVKDRWVYPLQRDVERASLLAIQDESLRVAMPWAEYREPHWHGGRWVASTRTDR